MRYLLVSGHYRKPINFTLDGLQAAKGPLKKLAAAVRALEEASGETLADYDTLRQAGPQAAKGRFSRAWDLALDNLNGAGALGEVFSELGRGASESPAAARDDLQGLAFIVHGLGLTLPEMEAQEAPAEIIALAEERIAARAAKDWAEADRLRDAIAAAGWTVKDSADGYELAAHE